jgi:hypothetical protein
MNHFWAWRVDGAFGPTRWSQVTASIVLDMCGVLQILDRRLVGRTGAPDNFRPRYE